MTDTQALLSELARVKAHFQLRTLSLILKGQSFLNPSPLDQRDPSPEQSHGLRVADAGGVSVFHAAANSASGA